MAIDLLPELTKSIIGSAIRVHRALGPGLLEGTYRKCLLHQLGKDGFRVRHEVPLSVRYEDVALDTGYRADVIVDDQVLLELKAVNVLLPVHGAQVLTYLKHSGLRVGLLINFNSPRLVDGLKRFVA
jgi:GxxExxY protein